LGIGPPGVPHSPAVCIELGVYHSEEGMRDSVQSHRRGHGTAGSATMCTGT